MSYTELTQGERYQIYALKKAGHKQTEIAEIMGRDPGTISWELRRNRRLKGYRPRQAHNVALVRRCNKVQPRISSWVWQQVEALIREQWSPEQVAGRLETKIYFAHPYASWEHGLNDNTNGLIRQYSPNTAT